MPQHKNPSVPRQLVGPSHISPSFSPAYIDPSSIVSGAGLNSKHRQIRTGPGSEQVFHLVGYQFNLWEARV